MSLTLGYGPLEAFFGSESGVTFQADDGGFLCAIDRGQFNRIEIVKNKNWSCTFLAEKLPNGKARLTDVRGFYLKRSERGGRQLIQVQKMTPDASCEFLVFTRNGKVVFKGDNGFFLSRYIGQTFFGMNMLEACKNPADIYCDFLPGTGERRLPKFVISRAAPTPGYGPLEVFFNASEGVSFRSDDGGYLCPIERSGFTCIEIVRQKNQFCYFLVLNVGNGKVRLIDSRGFYLRRTDRYGRYPIEVRQMTPDSSCEFQVFTRNRRVIFRGDNGLFLSRFYGGLYPNVHTLESVKRDADMYCELFPEIGHLAARPTVVLPSADITPGYGPLEVFFNAPEGVSFMADDGGFLSPIERNGFTCIEIVKEKNQSCNFLVENVGNGKVRLRDSRGFYLRRTDRNGRYPIEVRQMTPDASCEFKVFTRNGKIIFRGDNGFFLSRFTGGLYPNVNTLESVKPNADKYCEFDLYIGNIPKPTVVTPPTTTTTTTTTEYYYYTEDD